MSEWIGAAAAGGRSFAVAAVLAFTLFTGGRSPAYAQTINAEQRLVVAIPYELEQLELLAIDDPVMRVVLENAGSPLVRPPAGEAALYPSLAAADGFSRLPNGWQFTLPADAAFANGRRAEAADIAAAFRWYRLRAADRQQESIHPRIARALLNLAHVRADPGRRAVALELTDFNSETEREFLHFVAPLPMFDAALAKTFGVEFGQGTQIAFLGSTVVVANHPEDGLRLRRSFVLPAQPSPAASPAPSSPPAAALEPDPVTVHKVIIFRPFPSAAIALRKLRAGVVDIILMPTPAIIADIDRDPTAVEMHSPLEGLGRELGQWRPARSYWSTAGAESDRLSTERIIRRRNVLFDAAASQRFSLWGVEKS